MKTIASLATEIARANPDMSVEALAALAVLTGIHGKVQDGSHGAAGSIYTFLKGTNPVAAPDARLALYMASRR